MKGVSRMRKVKNAFIILLAVLLLGAGGVLPMEAARLQDQTTTNVVRYESIDALQLKLEQAEDAMSMSFYEKLYRL